MGKLDVSRRGFLKASIMAGVSVTIAPIGSRAFAALFEERNLTPAQADAATGQPKFRLDGVAKVTGAKVFARDIRAADMPHWPNQQSHAFILRTTLADRIYTGFDLALLGDELKPDRIVTAEDLARDGLAFPAFYGDDALLPPGKTPALSRAGRRDPDLSRLRALPVRERRTAVPRRSHPLRRANRPART